MFGEGIFEMFSDQSKDSGKEENSLNDVIEDAPGWNSSNIYVISLGGSALIKEKIDTSLIGKISHLLNDLTKQGFSFCIVVGGGKLARDYVAAARSLGANNFVLDELGIRATRLNAKLVIQGMENAYPEVLKDLHKAKPIIQKGMIPVFGGILPGITTDAVAALLAELLEGSFINLSNVDGVYDKDPRNNDDAEFISRMTHNELMEQILESTGAGANPSQNVILDIPCSLILKRSKIRTFILNAGSIDDLEKAIKGYEFQGTVIE